MQPVFSRELALKNALASTAMEGFVVTDKTRQDCLRLMNGEITVADLVREVIECTNKKGTVFCPVEGTEELAARG